MFWLSFAENLPGGESPDKDPAPSLFNDASDDELLEAADLEAIDESMQRAGGLDDALGEPLDEGEEVAEEDDAVDPAAADASMAYVEAHADDPPHEDEALPEGPLVWLVPWVISFAAHAALVIVAIFVVWSVQKVFEEDQVVIPLITLSQEPGTPLEVEVVERVETQTPAMAAPPVPEPMPLELDLEMELELPGVGEPMAAAAPTFELNLSDAAEFDTNFFGSGGNAKNIVFVVEADGSIISDYPEIVDELAKSLRDMNEKQQFSIIVFDGQDTKEVPPRNLKRATADAKGQAIKWLRDTRNVQNMGTGDPVKALKRAFALKPELIFLLSQNLYNPGRGKYEVERSEIIDAVEGGARNIVINTIQFNDVEDQAGLVDPATGQPRLSLLAEIARMTGGEYLTVTTNAVPLGN